MRETQLIYMSNFLTEFLYAKENKSCWVENKFLLYDQWASLNSWEVSLNFGKCLLCSSQLEIQLLSLGHLRGSLKCLLTNIHVLLCTPIGRFLTSTIYTRQSLSQMYGVWLLSSFFLNKLCCSQKIRLLFLLSSWRTQYTISYIGLLFFLNNEIKGRKKPPEYHSTCCHPWRFSCILSVLLDLWFVDHYCWITIWQERLGNALVKTL